MASSRLVSSRLKTVVTMTPKTAIAIRPAVRATALLMPEAVPAWCRGTALMTAVVKGGTVIAIPMPSTIAAGKKVVQ